MLGRRQVLTTAAAFAMLGGNAARAANSTQIAINGSPLFPTGELNTNQVADAFAATPQLTGPFALRLMDKNGPRDLSELTGKIRLLCLWAENFQPCLEELNELAELQSLYADDGFEIMACLTQSPGKLDFDAAQSLLTRIQADNLPLWIEPNGGNQTTRALSTMIGPYPEDSPMAKFRVTNIMPCTLLIDKTGRIRGRTLGSTLLLKKNAIRTRWETPLPADLNHSPLARKPTLWSGADADTFIKALKNGALEKLGEQA